MLPNNDFPEEMTQTITCSTGKISMPKDAAYFKYSTYFTNTFNILSSIWYNTPLLVSSIFVHEDDARMLDLV